MRGVWGVRWLVAATLGALHCLGYDDHDPNEFARMHTREDEILGAIGVGAVFGSSDPEGGR